MSAEFTLRELRYFVAVHRERSFSAAARHLRMSQPPLSQAIRSLERSLDVTLFERTTREVRPTAAADVLLPEATFLLQRASETASRIRTARGDGHVDRAVHVGAVTSAFTAFLPRLIAELTHMHFSVVDIPSSSILEEIRDGRLDLGLTRDVPQGDARHRQLAEERLFVAIPTEHRLKDRSTCTIAEIVDESLIAFDRARAPLAFDSIAACFRTVGATMRPVAHISSEQAALGLVRAQLGIALVPEILTPVPWEGVHFVALADSPVTYPLRMVVAPGDPLGLLDPVESAARRALSALGVAGPATAPQP